MIGLFFDSVLGKGTYRMIDLFFLIQYLGMIGLFFDSIFGNDWSVL